MGDKKVLKRFLMPLTMAVSSLLSLPVLGSPAAEADALFQSARNAAQTEPTAPQAVLTAADQSVMPSGHRSHSSHASHGSHRSHRSSAF